MNERLASDGALHRFVKFDSLALLPLMDARPTELILTFVALLRVH